MGAACFVHDAEDARREGNGLTCDENYDLRQARKLYLWDFSLTGTTMRLRARSEKAQAARWKPTAISQAPQSAQGGLAQAWVSADDRALLIQADWAEVWEGKAIALKALKPGDTEAMRNKGNIGKAFNL